MAMSDKFQQVFDQLVVIRDEVEASANTATRVGTALIDLFYLIQDGEYLSRVYDDSAEGYVTFEKGLQSDKLANFVKGLIADGLINANDGAEFGEFIEGLYTGKGGRIDEGGNAEVESLRVRSYMEVIELIINRLSAIEGDQVLTECDTIDRVEYIGTDESGDGIYKLFLRDKWEGYITGQVVHNILRGIINTLPGSQAGASTVDPDESGQSQDVGANKYYTSWMRVIEVNASPSDNWIKVVMYPGTQTVDNGDGTTTTERIVPAGKNFPPCKLMNIARWGYAVDYDSETMSSSMERYIRQRQTFLFFSSTDGGTISKYTHVNKPILEDYMYGFTIGELPETLATLAERYGYNKDRDVLFVPQILTNALMIIPDSEMPKVPKYRFTDCGEWQTGVAYRYQEKSDETDLMGNPYYDTDDVWHGGCKWRCMQSQPVKDGDGNDVYEEPKWNSSSWAFLEGNAQFSMTFADEEGYKIDGLKVRIGNIDEMIYPRVFFGYTDITDYFGDSEFSWSRITGNGEATELDVAWTNAYGTKAGGGDRVGENGSLHLRDADFPSGWERGKMRFVCRVVISDGLLALENYVGF